MAGDPGLTAVIAFDLDNCLIGSKDLIRRAYRDAGVEPPARFHELGHHNWIRAADREAVHAAKDAAYLMRLATEPLPLLAPWAAAETLRARGNDVAVLTGAPSGTIRVLGSRRLPSWPFTHAADGLSPAAKTEWLAGRPHGGVYVDDQQYVAMPPGWRLIRYTGQPAPELVRLAHAAEAVRRRGVPPRH